MKTKQNKAARARGRVETRVVLSHTRPRGQPPCPALLIGKVRPGELNPGLLYGPNGGHLFLRSRKGKLRRSPDTPTSPITFQLFQDLFLLLWNFS